MSDDTTETPTRPDVAGILAGIDSGREPDRDETEAAFRYLLHLERRSPEPLEWTRRDRVDGDPVWSASLGKCHLVITVECEWIWGWEVTTYNDHDAARGSVYCELGDDEDAEWDYQGIEAAQRRAESVARGLLGAPQPTEDRDMLEWAAEMGCEMEADDRDDYDPKVCSPDHTGRCWPCEARVRLEAEHDSRASTRSPDETRDLPEGWEWDDIETLCAYAKHAHGGQVWVTKSGGVEARGADAAAVLAVLSRAKVRAALGKDESDG